MADYAKSSITPDLKHLPAPSEDADSGASRVIWQWNKTGSTIEPPNQSRKQSCLHLVAGAIVASILFLTDSPRTALFVLFLSSFTFILGILSPDNLFPALESSLKKAGTALALGVTWFTILPLFILFFIPFRFLFRQKSRDSMKRFYEPGSSTYWTTSPVKTNPATTNKRQF